MNKLFLTIIIFVPLFISAQTDSIKTSVFERILEYQTEGIKIPLIQDLKTKKCCDTVAQKPSLNFDKDINVWSEPYWITPEYISKQINMPNQVIPKNDTCQEIILRVTETQDKFNVPMRLHFTKGNIYLVKGSNVLDDNFQIKHYSVDEDIFLIMQMLWINVKNR